MRILYASERPPYPFFLGGAARCAHHLLRSLALEHGVECLAVGSAEYSITPWRLPEPDAQAALGIRSQAQDDAATLVDCGYPVRVIPAFRDAFADVLKSFRPDVVWAQLEGAYEILQVVRSHGIQGLLYVHDAEFDPAELRAIAALGTHFVASSRFLAERVRRVTGRSTHVAYPTGELFFDTRGDSSGCVTMINPHRVKGIDTFLSVARSLPCERFLLVESWKLGPEELARLFEQLQQVPNVEFVPRVNDIRPIYARTKLLLVPSVWEEGFGMVTIEAQSCAIPVIASARGGLPESVGDGGILVQDYRNPDRWVRAIATVLGDPATYLRWSARALRHARLEQFQPGAPAKDFLAACADAAVKSSKAKQLYSSMCDRVRSLPILGRLLRRTMD